MNLFTRLSFTLLATIIVSSSSFGQILWGGPGDANGEFDGGLNDWTVNAVVQPDALWVWEEDADASEGAYAGAANIASPSAANGAAVFNSDFYDNGGVQGDFGLGPGPAPHNCELISPIIDLTGENFITLEFNQFYRNFDAVTSVVWSNDGGATWGDTINVNPTVYTNVATPNTSRKIIHLIGAGGTDMFRFKFVFEGEYYYWIIDDVSIIVRPDFDMVLGDFFYPPASYRQPVTQIDADTMGFFADVSNYGKVEQTDLVFRAQVLDGNTVVFSDEMTIPALAAETIDSTIELPELFIPDMLTTGNYDISYEIVSTETDYTPGDNSAGMDFSVHNSRYAKENGDPVFEAAFQPGGGGDYFVGNVYQTSPNWVDQFQVIDVAFAVAYNAAAPAEGTTVPIYLSKVNDNIDAGYDNFDVSDLSVSTHPDLTLRGFGEHTFTNEGSFDQVNATIEDLEFSSPGVLLDPGSRYFLLLGYESDAGNLFQVFNQRINYFQVSTLVVSTDWFFGGFGIENAANIRMALSLYTSTDENALPDESLTIYPNPVQDELNIGITLEEPSIVNVTLANLDGRVIQIDELINISEANRQYDVSNLPAGTYLVRLATEEGTKTKKFIVAR